MTVDGYVITAARSHLAGARRPLANANSRSASAFAQSTKLSLFA
jgi:hypothetical protein